MMREYPAEIEECLDRWSSAPYADFAWYSRNFSECAANVWVTRFRIIIPTIAGLKVVVSTV